MLRARVLGSTAETWLGRPYVDIPDGDMWRWWAVRQAAERIEAELRRGPIHGG